MTEKSEKSIKRIKLLKTSVLVFTWFARGFQDSLVGATMPDLRTRFETEASGISYALVGFQDSLVGATMPDLRTRFGTEASGISYALSVGKIGAMIGSLMSAFMDRYGDYYDLICGTLLSIMAGSAMLKTSSTWLWLFTLCDFVEETCWGMLGPGGQSTILLLWGIDATPYLQTMQLGFPIGASLGPLVASLFVSDNSTDTDSANSTSATGTWGVLGEAPRVVYGSPVNLGKVESMGDAIDAVYRKWLYLAYDKDSVTYNGFNNDYKNNQTDHIYFNSVISHENANNKAELYTGNQEAEIYSGNYETELYTENNDRFPDDSEIQYAFFIAGTLMLIAGIGFFLFYTFFHKKHSVHVKKSSFDWKEIFSPSKWAEGEKWLGVGLLTCMIIFFTAHNAQYGVTGTFITSYAVDSGLGFSAQEGAILNSVLHLSGSIGRFIAIFTANCITTKILFIFHTNAGFVTACLLALFGPTSKTNLYVFVALYGFFYRPIRGFTYGYLNAYMLMISIIFGLMQVFTNFFAIFLQALHGYLYDATVHEVIFYMASLYGGIMVIVYVVMLVFGRVYGTLVYRRGKKLENVDVEVNEKGYIQFGEDIINSDIVNKQSEMSRF